MADEEEKVESPKSGGNNLIVIIGVVLIAISLGLSAVSLITIMSMNAKLTEIESGADQMATDPSMIPLNEIAQFAFSDQFIFTFDGSETSKAGSIVTNIVIGVHSTEKNAEEVTALLATLAQSETFIRAGVETLVLAKTYDDFETTEGKEAIRAEIVLYLQEKLVTEDIIDVYFTGFLTSPK